MKTIDELGISKTPWKVRGRARSCRLVSDANEGGVCISGNHNARLIAAAPELYEALREMTELFVLNITEWNQALNDSLIEAKKAIAKASGEDAAK